METQVVTSNVLESSFNVLEGEGEQAGYGQSVKSEIKSTDGEIEPPVTRTSHEIQETKPYLMGIGSYDPILKVVGEYDGTTLKLFSALEHAYNYFKEALFRNNLSPVVLTLNRKARSMGYYKPNAWLNERNEGVPEININPSILYLPGVEVAATLVHELVHHFQFLHGHPGRRGYHNKEFSRLMCSIGLMCSDTGKPGGKVTGSAMAEYPVEGGLFLEAFNKMPKEYLLPFKPYEQVLIAFDAPSSEQATSVQTKIRNKVKYSCPRCHANAWAKPNAKLLCGVCFKPFIAID